ncbi:UNVERIFIED_CONTAM: hypothetical protein HDU68_003851 [Siphonaria sp. JEL0065]|nr:hypothetical protein HDU68_003851 [Siphonaria sp. JEL0065]
MCVETECGSNESSQWNTSELSSSRRLHEALRIPANKRYNAAFSRRCQFRTILQNWGSGYQFAVQSDGNMVIYDSDLAMVSSWRHSPLQQSITDLCVSSDGIAVLYDGMDVVWKNPVKDGFSNCGPVGYYQNINGKQRTCLRPNEPLGSCQYMKAGDFYVIMQTDGVLSVKSDNPFNLTLRGRELYPYISSAANGGFRISRTLDSVFVMSYSLPTTSQVNADQLCIQDDGDFVLYGGNSTLWAYPLTPGFAGGDECGPIGYNPGIRGDLNCLNPTDSLNSCRYVRSGNLYLTAHPSSFGNLAVGNGSRGQIDFVWESDSPTLSKQQSPLLPSGYFCFKGFSDNVAGKASSDPMTLNAFTSDRTQAFLKLVHRGYDDLMGGGIYSIVVDLGQRVVQTNYKIQGTVLRDMNSTYPPSYYKNGTYYLVLNLFSHVDSKHRLGSHRFNADN